MNPPASSPPVDEGRPTLPRIVPMLATAGSLPAPGDDVRWAYEMKWDGVRAMVYCSHETVALISRNDIDMTGSYPELVSLAAALPTKAAILDAEIVALDESGRPSFRRLQKRMHVQDPATARRLAGSDPAVLYVFDVLHLDGHSLLELSYRDRRIMLDELDLDGPSWQVPPVFAGSGHEALRISNAHGLEGIVAKRLDSIYRPGRRSPDWVKVKNVRTQEVVIGGWSPGQGRREDTLGALLLGIPRDGRLDYVGKVGTGFTDAMLDDLRTALAPSATTQSPFDDVPRPEARDAHWVNPVLVAEVSFAEWTGEGRLRHPVWRGLRPDKRPAQVIRET